jgi:CTD small phosphatase-like protein 2
MDETLLHAATLNDIYVQELYGKDAEPSFITNFNDRDQTIDIGVFLRPGLFEMLNQVSARFEICVFTASEKVYADAILNQVDPLRKIFSKRIYRKHCLKATLPPGSPSA